MTQSALEVLVYRRILATCICVDTSGICLVLLKWSQYSRLSFKFGRSAGMEDCQHCSAERVPSLKSGESRRDAPLLELC